MPSETDFPFSERVEHLFHQALELDAVARVSFLAASCNGDEPLRGAVERLLAASVKASEHPDWSRAALQIEAASIAETEPRLERYRLLERIGAGGMGVVYKAVRNDNEFAKTVAIKILHIRGENDITRRFLQERQILARLEHPNIARLLDGGSTSEGAPFLVIEYLDGAPINRYVGNRGRSPHLVLDLFVKICDAVSYAHRNLIVHRDLKPANILVTNEGEPKLLDFGIAKLLDENADRTVTGAGAMTPEYASPEQVRGEPITTASDIYSLGVVLYELLTGRSPYGKTSGAMNLATAICTADPQPTSFPGAPRIPVDLENIVRMALRKEPGRRYASAEQFADDIRRYRQGFPVLARPATRAYRVARLVGRNKVAIVAAASIVVLLVGGIAATTWEARLANRRFNDVRKLANSYLFEFHDAIRDLPGSTPARHLVVKRALEYLDSLAQEKTGDAALMSELAVAYEKVGSVQDAPNVPSLGDLQGALASYRKALEIREKLAASSHGDIAAIVKLANLRGLCVELLQRKGDLKAASDLATSTIHLLEKSRSGQPESTPLDDALATANRALADVTGNNDLHNLGDARGALTLYRKSLELRNKVVRAKPADREQRMLVGALYGRMATIHAALGDSAQSADSFRRALVTDEQLVQEEPLNVLYRREIAVYSRSLALIYVRLNNLDEAEAASNRSTAIFEQLAREDPSNAAARVALADSKVSQGYLLSNRKRYPEALAHYRDAVAIYDELIASHRSAPQIPLRTAWQLMANAALQTRDADLVFRAANNQLAIDRAMLQLDGSNVNARRNQGVALYQLGRSYELRGNRTKAHRTFQESVAIWAALDKEGKLIPSYRKPQQDSTAALKRTE